MNLLIQKKRKYTQEEKDYICSKITDMSFKLIPESLREFWLEWREKTRKTII